MIVTPGTFVRAGLLALAAVILQISGFGAVHVFGAYPDLIPLVVAAVAIYAGSVPGRRDGLRDRLPARPRSSARPWALSSLVLTAIGYGVGRYREVRDPAHGLMPIPVGAVATLGVGLALTPPCRSCSTWAPR